MAQEDVLLKMVDITKEFPGVKALNEVHLDVRPGTVHALMGENGAGKIYTDEMSFRHLQERFRPYLSGR